MSDPLSIPNLARLYFAAPVSEIKEALLAHPDKSPDDALVMFGVITQQQLEWLRGKQRDFLEKKPASVDVRKLLEQAARGVKKVDNECQDVFAWLSGLPHPP